MVIFQFGNINKNRYYSLSLREWGNNILDFVYNLSKW